jgi:hypothetical protein
MAPSPNWGGGALGNGGGGGGGGGSGDGDGGGGVGCTYWSSHAYHGDGISTVSVLQMHAVPCMGGGAGGDGGEGAGNPCVKVPSMHPNCASTVVVVLVGWPVYEV